jgi:hypothetical protein
LVIFFPDFFITVPCLPPPKALPISRGEMT